MTTGTIKYVADAVGLEIAGITLSQFPQTAGIQRVEIIAAQGRLTVTLHTEGVFENDRDSFSTEIERLYAAIAVESSSRIGPVYRERSDLPCKNGGRKRTVSSNKFDVNVVTPVTMSSDALNRAVGLMNTPSLLINEFRTASEQSDPITRFGLLYNIALQICGDVQKRVDQEILKIAPSTPTNTSSHTGRAETIYTRLRNELAHYRQKPIASTVAEIKKNVDSFLQIIRRMVSTYI
jgi:hypothetical protein